MILYVATVQAKNHVPLFRGFLHKEEAVHWAERAFRLFLEVGCEPVQEEANPPYLWRMSFRDDAYAHVVAVEVEERVRQQEYAFLEVIEGQPLEYVSLKG